MEIELIDYGIAFTVEEDGKRWIQVNKALLHHPKLLKAALLHEIGHLKRKGYLSNILYDIIDSYRFSNLAFWKFCLENPSSFMASMPLWKEKGKWTFNYSAISMLLLLLCAVWFAVWFNIK